jgi:hypothetical protein
VAAPVIAGTAFLAQFADTPVRCVKIASQQQPRTTVPKLASLPALLREKNTEEREQNKWSGSRSAWA